ncbi:uncharacterized protein BX663DRAFT_438345, partial [Cokeromyces recurvatus]|uniref:uncharacterized protein n=1 Tax=Cokeromyces recurvatus TaxID=90255 RepID=UPI00221EB1CB
NDLEPNGNNDVLFGNIIRSDGFDLDCLFYKRKMTIKDLINGLQIKLSDFNYQEVQQQYQPVFIDPGRKSVFTAADKFFLYQGRQRAPEIMTNMIINGGSKYNKAKRVKKKKRKKEEKRRKKKKNGDISFSCLNQVCTKQNKWKPIKYQQDSTKVPLIVFGSGMFGKDNVKLKGLRCGIVGKLYKLLKKREAEGQLIATTIDEFKTSKTYSLCFFDDLKIISTKSFKGVAVVCCERCSKVWQRDSNAANNMMTISKSI